MWNILWIEIRQWTHPQPAHLAIRLSVISDQSATLQTSKVTGVARHGHTSAGSQLVRTAALRFDGSIESSPERVPGNLFPSREIYFPGINNPNWFSENRKQKAAYGVSSHSGGTSRGSKVYASRLRVLSLWTLPAESWPPKMFKVLSIPSFFMMKKELRALMVWLLCNL